MVSANVAVPKSSTSIGIPTLGTSAHTTAPRRVLVPRHRSLWWVPALGSPQWMPLR